MAYFCTCHYCNQYFFGVSRRDIEDDLIEHQLNKHPDKPLRFDPIPKPDTAYSEYLKQKKNPVFWNTLRIVKKTVTIEARLKELEAEFPSLV
jgi:hypothetical protein